MLKNVSQYVINVGKSVTYATIDAIKEQSPALDDFVSTNQELFKDINYAFRDRKVLFQRIETSIKNSKIYEAADLGKKSLFEDLKTGKFYNKERIKKYQGKALGLESMMDDSDISDLNFDDSGIDIDFSDDFDDDMLNLSDGEIAIVDSVESTSRSSAAMISNAVAKSSDYIVESNKAIQKMNLIHNVELFNGLNKGLSTLNDNISNSNKAILDTITTHANNSKTYYEESTKFQKDITGMFKELLEMERNRYGNEQEKEKSNKIGRRLDDVITADGIPNLTDYFKVVGKNIKNMTSNITGMNSLFGEESNALLLFAASPLTFLSKSISKAVMGKAIKSSIEGLNSSIEGAFSTLLAKFNEMSKNENGLFSTIGKIFGIDTSMKTSIDSSQYNKGATQWNGKSEKALQYVIPTLLSKILSAVSGLEENAFDYNSGKFVGVTSVERSFKDTIKSASKNAGGDARKQIDKWSDQYRYSDYRDQKQYKDDINKFFDFFFKKGITFDHNKKDYEYYSDMGLDISEDNYNLIRAMFKSLPRKTQMQFGKSILEGRDSLNRQMNTYQKEGSVYDILFNGSSNISVSKYNEEKDELKTTGIINMLRDAKDEYGKNVFYYLQQLRSILIEGIKVYNLNGNDNINYKSKSRGAHQQKNKNDDNTYSNILNRSSYLERQDTRRKTKSKREEENYEKEIEKINEKQNKENSNVKSFEKVHYLNEMYDDIEQNSELKENESISDKMASRMRNMIKNDEDDRKLYKEANKEKSSIMKFIDDLIDSDNLTKKFSKVIDKFKSFADSPRKLISSTIDLVDIRLYEAFFGGEEETYKGEKVKGVLGRLKVDIKDTFNNLNTFLDDKILTPLAEKLGGEGGFSGMFERALNTIGVNTNSDGYKNFKNKFFGENSFYGRTKSEIGKDLSSLYNYGKNTVKEVYGEVADKIKNADDKENEDDNGENPTNHIKSVRKGQSKNINVNREGLKNRTVKISRSPSEDIMAIASALDRSVNKYDKGTDYVDDTELAVIHKGEAVITKEENRKRIKEELKEKRGSIGKKGKGKKKSNSKKSKNKQSSDIDDVVNEEELKDEQNNIEKNISASSDIQESIDNEEESNNEQEAILIQDSISDQIFKEIDSTLSMVKKSLLGTDNAEEFDRSIKKAKDDLFNNLDKYFPKLASGGVLGGIVGTVFMGNPVLGAVLGAATQLTINSQEFREYLFGEKVDGKYQGGALLGKKSMEIIQKYLPSMGKYGLAGAVTSLIPFVPGGPLAGLMIGGTIGFLKENEEARKSIFGNEFDPDKAFSTVKKKLPKVAVGALGTMMLGPFGFVGNAMLGSVIGWYSDTERFKKFVYGTYDEKDKEYHGGVLPFIRELAVKPLIKIVNYTQDGITNFIKDKVFDPIKYSMKSLARESKHLVKWVAGGISSLVSKMFKSTVGQPIANFLEKRVFKTFGRLFGWVGQRGIDFVKKSISLPINILTAPANMLANRRIAKGGISEFSDEELLFRYKRNKGKFIEMLRKSGMSTDEIKEMTSKFEETIKSQKNKKNKSKEKEESNENNNEPNDIDIDNNVQLNSINSAVEDINNTLNNIANNNTLTEDNKEKSDDKKESDETKENDYNVSDEIKVSDSDISDEIKENVPDDIDIDNNKQLIEIKDILKSVYSVIEKFGYKYNKNGSTSSMLNVDTNDKDEENAVDDVLNGDKINSFDVGTPYVNKTQIAMIHEGERILTKNENSDFSKIRDDIESIRDYILKIYDNQSDTSKVYMPTEHGVIRYDVDATGETRPINDNVYRAYIAGEEEKQNGLLSSVSSIITNNSEKETEEKTSIFDTISSTIGKLIDNLAWLAPLAGIIMAFLERGSSTRTDANGNQVENWDMNETLGVLGIKKLSKYASKGLSLGFKGISKIFSGIDKVGKGIKNTVTKVGSGVKNTVNKVKSKFKNNSATDDVLENTVKNSADDIAEGTVKNSADDIVEGTVKNSADDIIEGTAREITEETITNASDDILENSTTKLLLPSTITNVSDDILENSTTKLLPSTITNASDDIIEGTAREITEETVKKGAKETVSEAMENTVKNTNNKLITSFIKKAKEFLTDKIGKIMSKVGAETTEGVAKKGPTVLKKIFSLLTPENLSKFTDKLSKGAAKIVPIVSVITGTWAALTGGTKSETAHLFMISEEHVTFPMRVISSSLKLLLNISFAFIIDILNDISIMVLGINFLSMVATTIYGACSEFFGNDEALQELNVAQDQFKADYEKYKQDNGLEDFSMDAYNDMVNESASSKLKDKVSGVVDTVKNTASNVVAGAKDIVYTVKDKASNAIDYVKENGLAKSVVDGTKLLLPKIGDATKSGLEYLMKKNPLNIVGNVYDAMKSDLPLLDKLSRGLAASIESLTFGVINKDTALKGIETTAEIGKKIGGVIKDVASVFFKFTPFNIPYRVYKGFTGTEGEFGDKMIGALGGAIEATTFGFVKTEDIVDKKENIKDAISNLGKLVIDGIKDTIKWNPFTTIPRMIDGYKESKNTKFTDKMIDSLKYGLKAATFGVVDVDKISSIYKELDENGVIDGIKETIKKTPMFAPYTFGEGWANARNNNKGLIGKFTTGLAYGLESMTFGIIKKEDMISFFDSFSFSDIVKSLGGFLKTIFGQDNQDDEFFSNDSNSGTGKSNINNNTQSEPVTTDIINYSQKDPRWVNTKYNNSNDTKKQTLGDSGCAPMSAAIVQSAYKNKVADPVKIAKYSIDKGYKNVNGGTDIGFFGDYLSTQGIKSKEAKSKDDIINSLKDNKPVILLGRQTKGNSPFNGSSKGHYVVATGINKDGSVIINDPDDYRAGTLYDLSDTLNSTTKALTTSSTNSYISKNNRKYKNINNLSNFSGFGSNPFEVRNSDGSVPEYKDNRKTVNLTDAKKLLDGIVSVTTSSVKSIFGIKDEEETDSSSGDYSSSGGNTGYVDYSKVSKDEIISRIDKKYANAKVEKYRGSGKYFYEFYIEYGKNFDPILAAAISWAETGGSSDVLRTKNNPAGIVLNGSLATFSTIKDGIRSECKTLANYKTRDGLTTIEEIGAKYAPINASNDPTKLNNNWVTNVTKIYNEMTEGLPKIGGDSTASSSAAEAAVKFAEKVANDSSHGYDQGNRWGNPDYDCSGLVISALENSGIKAKTNGASYTGNMYNALIKSGMKDVTSSVNFSTGSGLKRGDVLLTPGRHTEFYSGNNQMVGARINENGGIRGGKPGDQNGKEIAIGAYRNYPWKYALRAGFGKDTDDNSLKDIFTDNKSNEDIFETKKNKVSSDLSYYVNKSNKNNNNDSIFEGFGKKENPLTVSKSNNTVNRVTNDTNTTNIVNNRKIQSSNNIHQIDNVNNNTEMIKLLMKLVQNTDNLATIVSLITQGLDLNIPDELFDKINTKTENINSNPTNIMINSGYNNDKNSTLEYNTRSLIESIERLAMQ